MLPDATGLAAYRIVQEAITNTIRHSHAEHVSISISTVGETLRVEVVDDGSAAHAGTQTDGLGLLGMRERAHALGGLFDHGPAAGGGYRVTAILPSSEEAR